MGKECLEDKVGGEIDRIGSLMPGAYKLLKILTEKLQAKAEPNVNVILRPAYLKKYDSKTNETYELPGLEVVLKVQKKGLIGTKTQEVCYGASFKDRDEDFVLSTYNLGNKIKSIIASDWGPLGNVVALTDPFIRSEYEGVINGSIDCRFDNEKENIVEMALNGIYNKKISKKISPHVCGGKK
jgi:hypothetical protein